MEVRKNKSYYKTYTGEVRCWQHYGSHVTKGKKHKLSLNDSAEQFDAQKTVKENKIRHIKIEMLTQQLQAMKEFNHYLRMQLNFIVGVKL
jgi:hypothetical protein